MAEIDKIVIHYKNGDKKSRVINKGFAGYFERDNEDLMLEFKDVNEKDIDAILRGLQHAMSIVKTSAPK